MPPAGDTPGNFKLPRDVDERIVKFIRRHHVLTLAVTAAEGPWCAAMFYAWLDKEGAFACLSNGATGHVACLDRNSRVAGTVQLETRVVGKLQGVQFTGAAFRAEGEWLERARRCYLGRFPYAVAMTGATWWIVRPDFIKMTDNRLGFGKKLIWNRNE